MKNIKSILIITGIILLTLATILIIPRVKSDKREDQKTLEDFSTELEKLAEVTTEAKEETVDDILSRYTFVHLDSIYYLSDDVEPFQMQIIEFLQKMQIEATTVNVLALHEDDLTDRDDKVYFYFQTDDDNNTVSQIIFDKSDKDFQFALYSDTIPDIEYYGGVPQGKNEKEILSSEQAYDYSEEEIIIPDDVNLYDLEESLSKNIDMEAFQKQLAAFLVEEGEERRNIYVDSFEKTDDGFEVILDFETPRSDGKVIIANGNSKGVFHFSLMK